MFPSWRYHRTLDARIIADAHEDEALGEGWADTPAAFLIPDEAPEEEEAAAACLKPTNILKKKRAK